MYILLDLYFVLSNVVRCSVDCQKQIIRRNLVILNSFSFTKEIFKQKLYLRCSEITMLEISESNGKHPQQGQLQHRFMCSLHLKNLILTTKVLLQKLLKFSNYSLISFSNHLDQYLSKYIHEFLLCGCCTGNNEKKSNQLRIMRKKAIS